MRRQSAAAIFAAILVFGCSAEDDGRTEFGPKPLFDPIVLPTSSTGSAIVPLPFDGLFGTDVDVSDDEPTLAEADNNFDGTLNLHPVLGDASLVGPGQVDGWSTSANLFFDLVGPVDVDAASNGIRIFDTGSPRELEPGVDFLVQASPVIRGRTRLIVHWLKPLNESTRYLVGITTNLRSPAGQPALVNEVFELLRSETPVSEQSSSILLSLTRAGRSADIATLQGLQQQLIGPVIEGLLGLSQALPSSRGMLGRTDIVLAWSFTTQSITPSLENLAANATAQAIGVQDSGLNLSQALSSDPTTPVPLPRDADVYAGFLQLPYYLSDSTQVAEEGQRVENILTTFWVNNGNQNAAATHPGLGAPCPALQRPTSTTICFPDPQQRSQQTVPVLLTRPEGTMPEGGWPAVIFIHGITGNRSNMFGIAPALSAAGFVVVAIDQPLHGLPPLSPLRVPGTTERTFDADMDQDGTVDDSGTHFINLPSLASSRDNLRQAAIDQIHLLLSLGDIRLGVTGSETINTDRVRLIGHSLGGIVGTTTLALTDAIGAATLAMPGGGIAKLLDGSQTFGPVIAAGLEQNGVIEGTDGFENFLRIAQLVSDPGDPINWAAQAAARHPIHLIEVADDAVVPNHVINNPEAVVDGFLSGTEPLVAGMGLATTDVDVPVSSATVISGPQHVFFSSGNHSSIVLPSGEPASDPVYLEMQNQTVQFLASNGACLPIGTNCPQAQKR